MWERVRHGLLSLCICFSVCFSGCAWSKRDIGLMALYTGLTAVDMAQTKQVFEEPDYDELNPILTEDNYQWVMVADVALLYLLAELFPEKYRTTLLGGACIVRGIVVGNNFAVGVGGSW